MATGLQLSGAGYAETPDHAALDITGDIDLRIVASMEDWTPAVGQRLLNKGTYGSNQLSYIWDFFMLGIDPTLQLTISPTGLDAHALSFLDLGPGPADGSIIAMRQIIDVDNGGGVSVTTTYSKASSCSTALADAESDAGWNEMGTSGLGQVVSLHSGTAPLHIGNGFAGCIFAAVVKDGIAGTTVANPDFTGSPTFPYTDGAGRVWSFSGDAAISSVCCGEMDFWGWADDFGADSEGWAVIG